MRTGIQSILFIAAVCAVSAQADDNRPWYRRAMENPYVRSATTGVATYGARAGVALAKKAQPYVDHAAGVVMDHFGPQIVQADQWTRRKIDENFQSDREACTPIGQKAPSSPTIVVYGDSMSSGFPGYDSTPKMVAYSRFIHRGWPIGPDSLCSLIRKNHPDNQELIWNVASPGSRIDPSFNPPSYARTTIAGTRQLSDQVDLALTEKQLAPLHVFFIGHNDMDWKTDVDVSKLDEKSYREHLPSRLATGMEIQLRRLTERARKDNKPVTMLVYGLPNMADGFKAINDAIALNKKDPKMFPFVERVHRTSPSYNPENAEATLDLLKRSNEALEQMVEKLNRQNAERGLDNVRIVYSDATQKNTFEDLSFYSCLDGCHPGQTGRAKMAKVFYDDLKQRDMIGLATRPTR